MISRRLLATLALSLLVVGACSDDPPVDNNNDTNNTNNSNNPHNNVTMPDCCGHEDMEPDMSMPDTFDIPGLSAPVTVHTDTNGMTHIQCATDHDCISAQGYIHARDRFAQMDLRRRIARGRVSSLAGALAIGVDRGYRNRFLTRDGDYLEDAFYDRMSPEARGYVDAYTVGVNAWLADLRANRNGAVLSDEYKFPVLKTDVIPDWEGQDTTACALILMDDLSNSSGTDLRNSEYTDLVDADVLFEVLGQMSATGSATLHGDSFPNGLRQFPDRAAFETAVSRVKQSVDIVRKARESLMPSDMMRQEEGFGSNNWVVGPDHTTTGKAMLANDPHLGLTNPALWYLVSLDSKTNGTGDLLVTGFSFAGIPSILLGHNEHVAWGATVVFYDMADVYVEELDATGTKVMFDGAEVDIIEIEHTYEVANGDNITETLRVVPHHGPIIEYDADNQTALSLRWTGHDAGTDFDAFFGLAKAANIDDAEAALRSAKSTNQNFVVMDSNDNIGWFPYSLVPIRPWASLGNPPWMTLPGTGGFEWEGYMDYDDLPSLQNPSRGFVITANQDATGALVDGDPTNDGYNMLQSFPAPGYRHQRIVDLIEGRTLSADDMVQIQGDSYQFFGKEIVDQIGLYLANVLVMFDADTQRVWDALQAWEGTCPTGLVSSDPTSAGVADAAETAEAIGCAVFHTLLFHLADEIFGDELGATIPTTRAYSATYIQMTQPGRFTRSYWDDVTTDDVTEDEVTISIRALEATGASMKQRFTTDTDKWRWGRMHVLIMGADLLSNLVSTYNNGPFAAPGGQWTVNVANPGNIGGENYAFRNGPSMRMVVENTANGLSGRVTLPGGQHHFRDSPYYDNLIEGWLNNTPIALPLHAADIAPIVDSTIVFNE